MGNHPLVNNRGRDQGAGILTLAPGRAVWRPKGNNVDGTPARWLRADELTAVGKQNDDPELRALEIAIFVEEVVGFSLADDVLDAKHLGTPDAVRRVVDGWGREP